MTTSSNEKKLTKKELNSLFWRSFTTSHAWHFERQQHMAFCWSMIPAIKKLYDNREDRIAAYQRHLEFYNCQTSMQPLIGGIVAAMEEENANNEGFDTSSISSMKVALMGPLAGIGDSIIQGIIVPTLLSIGMSLANGGSPLGPLFYIVAYGILGPVISFISYRTGYKLGVGAIDVIVGESARRIMDAFNVLGIMVVGALAAGNIALTTTLNIPFGDEWQPLQTTLDGVFPALLPLIAVLATWWMLGKKQYSPTKVIVILAVAISVLCVLGVF